MDTLQQMQIGDQETGGLPRTSPPSMAQSHGRPHIADVLRMMGMTMKIRRDGEIYGEGEPSEFVYLVVRGVVRTYKLTCDGRRQIAAFCLPGDIFGCDIGPFHAFTAEAVQDSEVILAKRSAVMALADESSEFASEMWQETARELTRAQEQLLLLGRKNAQEKVAAFLLEMADRTQADGPIELPMSRQDIADYLGLTIETVSRTFSHMENQATIALPKSRRIELRDLEMLTRLNS
jgi:CRP/FNR family nitrogen fixation transcriptional regulator